MGELASLSASALWAIASVLFAQLGREKISPLALNLLKCALALAMLWLTMLWRDGHTWPWALGTPELVALAISGVIGLTIGDTAFFGALTRLGARRTLLMMTLAPPATAVMAWPFLGEPITLKMLAGMALTMGGIAWVIRERTGEEEPDAHARREELLGLALVLVAVLCQAGGNVLTKFGGEHISSLSTSVVRLAFGVLGLGVVVGGLGRARQVVAPLSNGRQVALLIVATFLGTYLGIWLLVTGLQYADAGVAATLSSTSPIFVLPIAAFFLGERLTTRSMLGACVAVAGVALLSFA